jgi:hypothetical protein
MGRLGAVSIFILSMVLLFCGCNQEVDSGGRVSFSDVKPLVKLWDDAFGEHEIITFFEDSPDEELYYFGWMAINSGGDYFVFDGKIRIIYQFDKSGKVMRTIGRQGQGPGEFDIPRFPQFDENDNLYLFDNGRKQILKFSSPDYQFEKSIKLGRYVQDLYRDDTGGFVVYSLYSMEYKDVLFKLSNSGEVTGTAFTPESQDFRIFISRFQIGGFSFLEESNELLFLYPYDYELHLFDTELNLKKVLYPARSSSFTPKGVPFPKNLNPYDYSPQAVKWWEGKLQPITPYGLGNGMFLVEVAQYDNYNSRSFANIHDTDGNTYAEGLEVPHTIIRYAKDGYIYIVEDSSPLRLHRYKLTIQKKD